jgi:hypothetical protein
MFVSGPMEVAADMERHPFGMQANVAFDSPRSTAPLDVVIVGTVRQD